MAIGRSAMASLLLAGLLLAGVGGCRGGDDSGSGSEPGVGDDDEDQETTTTTEVEDLELPENHRADLTVTFDDGFTLSASATVVDATTYQLVIEASRVGRSVEERRIDGLLFVREAETVEDLEEALFVELDPFFDTAVAAMGQVATATPEELGDVSGVDVVSDAVSELLLTDPAGLVDDEDLDPDDDVDFELPLELTDPLEAAGLTVPGAVVESSADGSAVDGLEVRIDDGERSARYQVMYTDIDEVDDDEVVEPDDDELDPTPLIDEEALAAFTDVTLVAPTAPPAGLVLVGAVVLDRRDTFEGCAQVLLVYESPDGGDFLELFLLPRSCAEAADPAPFDDVIGGLPGRKGPVTIEVLLGDTAVQFATPEDLSPAALDALAASLAPITAEALVAAIEAG